MPANPVILAAAVPGIKNAAREPKPCPNCVLNLSSYPSAAPKALSFITCCAFLKALLTALSLSLSNKLAIPSPADKKVFANPLGIPLATSAKSPPKVVSTGSV